MCEEADWFKKLELCNAEIDILIDEERYPEIWEKLPLRDAEVEGVYNKVWKPCFSESCSHVKDKEWDDAFLLKGSDWPLKIIIFGQEELEITSEDWSALFWAKRLRAKIQEKNTDCYERRLDDLVGYLERNLPEEPKVSRGLTDIPNSFKLYFYYLMELSATSLDYEQIGYAKRASRLLHRLPRFLRDPLVFTSFSSTANRWIKYSTGMAYRHLKQDHTASLEFNELISEYEKNLNGTLNGECYLGGFERDLFYYPAVMNRAIIQLQSQFPYHTLKTLAQLPIAGLSSYKSIQRDLYRAQALRMLENRKESEKKLSELSEQLFLVPFTKFQIPDKSENGLPQERIALKTRFVELAVNEYMEIVKGVGFVDPTESKFRLWIENKSNTENHNLDFVAAGFTNINSVFDALDTLWPWVKNKRMDRHGYYRQLAELLAWSAKAIRRWEKQSQHTEEIDNLINTLKARINGKSSEILSKICSEDNINPQDCIDCSINTIKLGHFHGEDLESVEKDITAFLSEVSKVKEKWFDDLEDFKKRFANAVSKRESTKGEDLHIDRLKLRNELRLFKHDDNCNWCMDGHTKSAFDKFFGNLNPCRVSSEPLLTRGRFITCNLFRKYCKVFTEKLQKESKITSDMETSLSSCKDYDQIMSAYEYHFERHLSKPSMHDTPCKEGIHFLGLQRWNSISPAEGLSLGGGYLLYRTTDKGVVDLGIAIDPGFDFIRNLFHCGFSLADIDVILLSHGHLDHVRDFESMISLLKELDGRTGESRRINVILTLGTYRRLQHVFLNPALRRYVEPLVIDIEKDIQLQYFGNLGEESSDTRFLFSPSPPKPNKIRTIWTTKLPNGTQPPEAKDLVIWPTRAYHDDYTKWSDSFGFKIRLPVGNAGSYLVFGYTGDTKWVGHPLYSDEQAGYRPYGVAKQYLDCDVLLIHLGSLIDHRNGQHFFTDPPSTKKELREKCVDLVRDKNHPYLPGLIGFLNRIWGSDRPKPGLLLLGEFGEELRGQIRTDLVQRLREVYRSKVYDREILPVDIGLDVACEPADENGGKAAKFEFWCVQCSKYHPIDRVSYQHFGQDEALFYLCRTCKKTTSPDVLQESLKHAYELGQTLRTDDSKSVKNR
jgi:ribonuclease BN (tRNA processing enzyme)